MIGWLIAGALFAIFLILFVAFLERIGYRDEMQRSRDLIQEEEDDRRIKQIKEASQPMPLDDELRKGGVL